MMHVIFTALAAYLIGLLALTLAAVWPGPPAYGQMTGGPNCRQEGSLRMTCTYEEPNGARYEMVCQRRSSADPWKCERRRAY